MTKFKIIARWDPSLDGDHKIVVCGFRLLKIKKTKSQTVGIKFGKDEQILY